MNKLIVIVTLFVIPALACGSSAPTQPTIEPTIDKLETAQPTLAIIATSISTPKPTYTSIPIIEPTDTTSPLNGYASCINPDALIQVGLVTTVVDGDTIDVSIDGQEYKVRYIGIDTPETKSPDQPVEIFGPEAETKNRELVENQTLVLVKDLSETDQFGRLLRYVFVGDLNGIFVNYALVRQGFAKAVTYPPDVACAETFKQAEEMSRLEGLGFWSPTIISSLTPIAQTTIPSRGGEVTIGEVVILTIFFDGIAGDNEPDEYVEIRNDGAQPIELQGWTLVDKADHTFTFPSFMMQAGQICRVYTNEIHPETCGFSFSYSESAIWNNGGDCAYLRDAQGVTIDDYCY